MASIANVFVNPFRQGFRYVQRQAHENPVILYAIAVGAAGPLSVLIVPPIRKRLGYVSPPRPPTTYPLPRRERDANLSGFDDPEES